MRAHETWVVPSIGFPSTHVLLPALLCSNTKLSEQSCPCGALISGKVHGH